MWKCLLTAAVLATAGPMVVVAQESDEATEMGEMKALLAARRSPCSRTSDAALRACGHEIRDDYWIAVGKCLNLTDEEERAECLEEAREMRSEDLSLCGEQFEVREEVCDLLGGGPYDPEIDPDDFFSPEEAAENPNPYFPLIPGMRWVYEGGDEVIEVTVTEDTREILGVDCFVVTDVVRENNEVIEDTQDWYALDREGNVRYFGEFTQTLENGELKSLEGSWEAGVDGGKAGIIMKADPQVGDFYRQEFLLGDVEDVGQVISINGDEQVPAASCDGHCVVTHDFTAIEPGIVENKYYARDIGLILELNPDTHERVELVEFHSPNPRIASPTRLSDLRVDVQSYPNPLLSESMIQFDLSGESDVSADIYDVAGRRVQSLVTGRYGAGSHAVRWDGTDANNNRVATGIYFVRVQTGDNAMTRKVVIVR